MKNELTAEEWLALAEFVKGVYPSLLVKLSPMFEDVDENKVKAAERAKEKFLETAKEIDSHML